MALQLYLHPLSSYCHKVLIAFYENDIPFVPCIVDSAEQHSALRALWPVGKFPVLHDTGRGHVVPESSIIIEYLARHHPGAVELVPRDPDRAWQVRLRDRFCDTYLHGPVQKLSGDRLRPAERRDPAGVDEARGMFRVALDMLDADIAGKTWLMGDAFTMADCAAAPALHYGAFFFGAFGATHPNAWGYLQRLEARPSYARALREAAPYRHLLPR